MIQLLPEVQASLLFPTALEIPTARDFQSLPGNQWVLAGLLNLLVQTDHSFLVNQKTLEILHSLGYQRGPVAQEPLYFLLDH